MDTRGQSRTRSRKHLTDFESRRGFVFTLAKVVKTTNEKWFDEAFGKGFTSGGNQEASDGTIQKEMKNALHTGGPGDLNLYSVGFVKAPGTGQGSLLGYATFP